MSEHKFTPGPWTAENSSVITQDNEIVAQCVIGNVYRGSDEEDYATANLIAAAPDLYAALELVANNPLRPDVEQITDAALAKARGEQP